MPYYEDLRDQIKALEAPVHEVVYSGGNLMAKGCLEGFPIPISTPG